MTHIQWNDWREFIFRIEIEIFISSDKCKWSKK